MIDPFTVQFILGFFLRNVFCFVTNILNFLHFQVYILLLDFFQPTDVS